jgi:hypothetical protein
MLFDFGSQIAGEAIQRLKADRPLVWGSRPLPNVLLSTALCAKSVKRRWSPRDSNSSTP